MLVIAAAIAIATATATAASTEAAALTMRSCDELESASVAAISRFNLLQARETVVCSYRSLAKTTQTCAKAGSKTEQNGAE